MDQFWEARPYSGTFEEGLTTIHPRIKGIKKEIKKLNVPKIQTAHSVSSSVPNETKKCIKELDLKVKDTFSKQTNEWMKNLENDIGNKLATLASASISVLPSPVTYDTVSSSVGDRWEADARSVYVGNVEYGTTAQCLEYYFRDCGIIKRLTIPYNRYDGYPKGYAYIEFSDQTAVQYALAKDQTLFCGRYIKVRPKRTNYPGYYTKNEGNSTYYFYGKRKRPYQERCGYQEYIPTYYEQNVPATENNNDSTDDSVIFIPNNIPLIELSDEEDLPRNVESKTRVPISNTGKGTKKEQNMRITGEGCCSKKIKTENYVSSSFDLMTVKTEKQTEEIQIKSEYNMKELEMR